MGNEYNDIYWKIAEIMESCKKTMGRIDAGLVGVAGSFWVMSILSREGMSFMPKFGRYRYDIKLDNGKTIEVKSSTLKVSNVAYYAWNAQKRPDSLRYDFLWCVAIPENLKLEPSSYLFTKAQIEKMPPAGECKNVFEFWGKQYKQIAYMSDEKMWNYEETMGEFEKYNLKNIGNLRSFLT